MDVVDTRFANDCKVQNFNLSHAKAQRTQRKDREEKAEHEFHESYELTRTFLKYNLNLLRGN